MEYCWHTIRKKMAEPCSLTNSYGPGRALCPEQMAVKLLSNKRMRVEWDILRTTERIMDEIDW
jgi:hypothetical protein